MPIINIHGRSAMRRLGVSSEQGSTDPTAYLTDVDENKNYDDGSSSGSRSLISQNRQRARTRDSVTSWKSVDGFEITPVARRLSSDQKKYEVDKTVLELKLQQSKEEIDLMKSLVENLQDDQRQSHNEISYLTDHTRCLEAEKEQLQNHMADYYTLLDKHREVVDKNKDMTKQMVNIKCMLAQYQSRDDFYSQHISKLEAESYKTTKKPGRILKRPMIVQVPSLRSLWPLNRGGKSEAVENFHPSCENEEINPLEKISLSEDDRLEKLSTLSEDAAFEDPNRPCKRDDLLGSTLSFIPSIAVSESPALEVVSESKRCSMLSIYDDFDENNKNNLPRNNSILPEDGHHTLNRPLTHIASEASDESVGKDKMNPEIKLSLTSIGQESLSSDEEVQNTQNRLLEKSPLSEKDEKNLPMNDSEAPEDVHGILNPPLTQIKSKLLEESVDKYEINVEIKHMLPSIGQDILKSAEESPQARSRALENYPVSEDTESNLPRKEVNLPEDLYGTLNPCINYIPSSISEESTDNSKVNTEITNSIQPIGQKILKSAEDGRNTQRSSKNSPLSEDDKNNLPIHNSNVSKDQHDMFHPLFIQIKSEISTGKVEKYEADNDTKEIPLSICHKNLSQLNIRRSFKNLLRESSEHSFGTLKNMVRQNSGIMKSISLNLKEEELG